MFLWYEGGRDLVLGCETARRGVIYNRLYVSLAMFCARRRIIV